MIITPEFPFVAKVGHAHAGYGKVKIKNNEEMHDFKSLAALHGDYVTLEVNHEMKTVTTNQWTTFNESI